MIDGHRAVANNRHAVHAVVIDIVEHNARDLLGRRLNLTGIATVNLALGLLRIRIDDHIALFIQLRAIGQIVVRHIVSCIHLEVVAVVHGAIVPSALDDVAHRHRHLGRLDVQRIGALIHIGTLGVLGHVRHHNVSRMGAQALMDRAVHGRDLIGGRKHHAAAGTNGALYIGVDLAGIAVHLDALLVAEGLVIASEQPFVVIGSDALIALSHASATQLHPVAGQVLLALLARVGSRQIVEGVATQRGSVGHLHYHIAVLVGLVDRVSIAIGQRRAAVIGVLNRSVGHIARLHSDDAVDAKHLMRAGRTRRAPLVLLVGTDSNASVIAIDHRGLLPNAGIFVGAEVEVAHPEAGAIGRQLVIDAVNALNLASLGLVIAEVLVVVGHVALSIQHSS